MALEGEEVRYKVTMDLSEPESRLAKMAILVKTMEDRVARLDERIAHMNTVIARAETTKSKRK